MPQRNKHDTCNTCNTQNTCYARKEHHFCKASATFMQELCRQRSMRGKLARRDALDGKVIVFITAGYSGKRFIFERARKLGIRSVVIDSPDR